MGSWTTKLLVIANQTADSAELRATLAARAETGPILVTLVAPATPEPGGSGREATEERLHRAVEGLREAGIVVKGVVGDPDPVAAVHDIWDPRRFDEVIVSTLPRKTSRWLEADLPRRVEKITDARVAHVVAKARQPVT